VAQFPVGVQDFYLLQNVQTDFEICLAYTFYRIKILSANKCNYLCHLRWKIIIWHMTTSISAWKYQWTGRTRCPCHQDRRPMMNEHNPSEGKHLSIRVYGVILRKTIIFIIIVVKNSTFVRHWLVGKRFWVWRDEISWNVGHV
jgi:hypothetical protein